MTDWIDLGADKPAGGARFHDVAHSVAHGLRQRRPSGAPPPLPRHLRTTGVGWLVALVICLVASVAMFSGELRGWAIPVTAAEDSVVQQLARWHLPGLFTASRVLVDVDSFWTIMFATDALILAMVVFRRWRHLLVLVVAIRVLHFLVGEIVEASTRRPRPFGVPIRADWGGWAMPSQAVGAMTLVLVAALYTMVPEGRARNVGKWVVGVLIALMALARLHLGVVAPSDVVVGVVIGTTVPLLGFRFFTPGDVFPVSYRRGRRAHLDVGGARGHAIRQALEEQLGLVVTDVRPFGLAGSAGSTPLRIECGGDPGAVLFGKLYARSHLGSDRWYKLGRELLYGRLEDEKPFNTVRRLVQQEDYALRLMRDAGLPSPEPFGFVELTPEREYVLVTEFFEGATELGEAEVDDAVIDDGLGIVRKLWDAGLAHRDIKPANLLVRQGRLLLIDVAFAEVRPTPWRQAVDLANMMLCLALRSSAERVHQRALRQFSTQEITEAFAAARGLALPSQLRRALRSEGRDLHADFLRLLPEPPRPIKVQRWSVRRLGLWAVTIGVFLFVTGTLANIFTADLSGHTPLGISALRCEAGPPLWLQAQAVPSASMVPCVSALPLGWTFHGIDVNRGRSVLTLDHDRGGNRALVARLTAACDTQGASEVAADQPGARRLAPLSTGPAGGAARWYEVFPGGCVTVQLHSDSNLPEVNTGLSAEASRVVALFSRAKLSDALMERTSRRLQLDPKPAG